MEFEFGDPDSSKEFPSKGGVVEKIKYIRESLDDLIHASETRFQGAMYTQKACEKMVEARCMLGNTLKELGKTSPYTGPTIQRRKGNSREIPDMVDTGDRDIDLPDDQIDALDEIRVLVQDNLDLIKNTFDNLVAVHNEKSWAISYMEDSVRRIALSRNYYGLQLGAIRDDSSYHEDQSDNHEADEDEVEDLF